LGFGDHYDILYKQGRSENTEIDALFNPMMVKNFDEEKEERKKGLKAHKKYKPKWA